MASATITSVGKATSTYVTPFALTTTFTPPPQCFPTNAGGAFVMLQNRAFEIWLNPLMPVEGTTITSCYPSQYVSSLLAETSSIPQAAFSPLVCPSGWQTMGPYTNNYIACCPSGWGGIATRPEHDAPSNRPASGATCYTPIYNVPIPLTVYDTTGILSSTIWTATSSLDQAYAHAYDGFAFGVAVVSSIPLTATTTSSSSSSTSTPTLINNANSPSQKQHHRASPGAIAGAVLGSILLFLLLLTTTFLFFRARKRRAQLAAHNNSSNYTSSTHGYARRDTFNSSYPSPLTAFSHGSNTTMLQPGSRENTLPSPGTGEMVGVGKDDEEEGYVGVHELEANPGVAEMDTCGFGSPRYNEKQH